MSGSEVTWFLAGAAGAFVFVVSLSWLVGLLVGGVSP
jgi:hypothetical protein